MGGLCVCVFHNDIDVVPFNVCFEGLFVFYKYVCFFFLCVFGVCVCGHICVCEVRPQCCLFWEYSLTTVGFADVLVCVFGVIGSSFVSVVFEMPQ